MGLAKEEVSADPILKEYPLIKTIFTALHYTIASEPFPDSPQDLQPLDPSVRLQHAWRDKFLAPSSRAASSEVWRKQERQGVLPFSFHSPSGTEAVLLDSEPDFRSKSRMFQVKGDFLQTQYLGNTRVLEELSTLQSFLQGLTTLLTGNPSERDHSSVIKLLQAIASSAKAASTDAAKLLFNLELKLEMMC